MRAVIHNRGLSEAVKNEELSLKALYPREMIPEDGSISGTKATIDRHCVLCDGNKMEKYGKTPLVNREHIGLVVDHGDERDATLNYEKGDVTKMSYTKLESLMSSTDQTVSETATELHGIINKNRHNLLDDEVNHILHPLGVNMKTDAKMIFYYHDTERMSVKWGASTESIEDTVRLVLIAPPNHPDKMDTAVDIVTSRPELAEKIGKELEVDGLNIHPSWKDYGFQ